MNCRRVYTSSESQTIQGKFEYGDIRKDLEIYLISKYAGYQGSVPIYNDYQQYYFELH